MNDFVDELSASWRSVRPDIDTTPVEVISRLLRVAQAIQINLDSLVGADKNLSHKGDLDTLTALRRAGSSNPLSPTTLAQVGQLTSGGMTNRIDRLAAAGLVSRQPDQADRRGVLVSLTREGERVADEAFAVSIAAQRDLLAPLSKTEQTATAHALKKMSLSLGDLPVRISQGASTA